MATDSRTERDALGEFAVPATARYGIDTARAAANFPISGERMPRALIRALGMLKAGAARANRDLALIGDDMARAIQTAAEEVANGQWDEQFIVDVFQTGSGTSTNMNANEVIAHRANAMATGGVTIHPNDDVNMSQSSNDVIPAAIHVAAALEATELLLPALRHLHEVTLRRADELQTVVKTGRTHLMDATPVTLGQEIGGWAAQIELAIERIEATLPRVAELAIGGTAVGTGINADPAFGSGVAAELARVTGFPFVEARNHFAAQASMDTAAELSGQLKAYAVGLMKIANDLRFMNSGPQAGFGEIVLPPLQPGSSIMPGKINPVICEATMMVGAQVIGN